MENEVLLAIGLGVIVVALIWLKLKIKSSPKAWKLKANQNLADLHERANSFDPHQVRAALIDVDKLLDFVLKSRSIKGETLGERLRSAEKYFEPQHYNQIWNAHRLRNQLVHEINFNPDIKQMKQAYDVLKRAIAKLS